MEDRKWRKLSWLASLLIMLCLAITPNVKAQDDDDDDDDSPKKGKDKDKGAWMEVEGEGVTEDDAKANAFKKAVIQFLEENLESETFNANKPAIEKFALEGMKKYVKQSQFKKYNRESETIAGKLRLKEEYLLKQAKEAFKKSEDKLAGVAVAIVPDDSKAYKNESYDIDTVFDTVQGDIGRFVQCYNMKDIRTRMKQEAQALGISASGDPGAYVQATSDMVQVVVHLWVTTESAKDDATGLYTWYATIGCRGVHIQTGQELWHFQIKSGESTSSWSTKPVPELSIDAKEARIRAMKDVSKAVVKKIQFEMNTRSTALKEGHFILKFVGFNNDQRDKVENTINDLTKGKTPPFEIMPGGSSSGTGFFSMKIKWLRGGGYFKLKKTVQDKCKTRGVGAQCVKYTQGVFYFEPAKMDEAG